MASAIVPIVVGFRGCGVTTYLFFGPAREGFIEGAFAGRIGSGVCNPAD